MFLKEVSRIRPLFNRSDKVQYVLLLGLMLFGSFLDVLGIGAIPVFIATLAAPEQIQGIPVVGGLIQNFEISPGPKLVVFGATGLMTLFILRNVFLYFIRYLQVRITEHHRVRLTDTLFQAYLEAPWETHLTRDSATILRNVNIETVEIMTGIVNPLLSLAMQVMMTVLVVILLILTTPPASFVGVILIGATIWAFLFFTRKRVEEFGEQARAERKNIIKVVNQSLASLPELKVLGKEKFFQSLAHQSVSNFSRATRLRQAINLAAPLVLEVVAVIGILGIVVVMVLAGEEPKSLLTMLALYAAAVVRLRQYISTISLSINQMQFSKAAIPNVMDELTTLKKQAQGLRREATTQSLDFNESIRITELSYSYPGSETCALSKIDLVIRKGQSVGFVGGSGSGKSTLVNVILGLLVQQEGSVTIDNVNTRENMRGWLDHIGYIPQIITLLDDSIRRNIAFGIADDEINEAQVQTVVEAAQLKDFILELPQGLDTIVGERGVRLSGGQRQRIGIARALYTNPDVIVMDEATAALDNQTEEQLISALNELKGERTFVIVAHRLTTIRSCDQLYFLNKGKIDAVGTYDDLIRDHSNFRAMAAVL